MFPLKKTWLYPAIASIALLATACANNAAPNYTTPNRTTTNQAAPHVTNFDGVHTRSYDGMRARDIDGYHSRSYDGVTTRGFDGIHTRSYNGTGTGMYPGNTAGTHNYNAYTAFPDGNVGLNSATGTAGVRGVNNGTMTGTTNGMNHSIYQKHAWNRAGAGVMQTGMPRMGYVQTDRQHMRTAGVNHNVYVDRDALAQAVGNVTTSCPGVQRSTVLVTDEEIFVGLHTNGGDAKTAKNQARMNALSVSPRYYKVYVTDNQNDIQEIARVAARSSNLHNARTEDTTSIDTLIKRMGGTTDSEQVRAKSTGTKGHMNGTHTNKMGTTSR
ncbi:YhcN/YlaJ family sporulation lipoprotein [Brevibacillus nitrificans]|nr:YhcN/YlaJ family sporulation lipoprotein [Brevibacillus nitrificans]